MVNALGSCCAILGVWLVVEVWCKVSSAYYTAYHIYAVPASEQGGSIAAALHPGLAPFFSLLRRCPNIVIPALTERTAIAILAPPFFRRRPCRRILAFIPLFG